MRLLHGSYMDITTPDLALCKANIDQEIDTYKREFGEMYLEEANLRIFASRVSQFGYDYVQYCFCTQRAIDELIKD